MHQLTGKWEFQKLLLNVKSAQTICSNENVFKTGVEHLRKVFVEINSDTL